ncbi:MAG: DnaJ domain-containing protein [Deltaproteobacteria bacterium]|nr:DnaJ domain-containing protein [Deltaproteobacteria bacterium]
MQSGTLRDPPLIELLLSLAAQRANGRLECGDGRRKWTFWFEGGRLSATKSNLKSEALESLEAKHPDVGPDELARMQGVIRVHGALRAIDGEWSFTPNDAPPARKPVDLLAACWSALGDAVPDDLARARLAGLDGRFPRLKVGGGVSIDELPFPAELRAALLDLDGQRTLADVLDFIPTPPEVARRGVYLGLLAGVISVDEQGASTPKVIVETASPRAAEAKPAAPPAEADPELDRLRAEQRRVNGAANHFERLGVAWDADPAEQRKAYMRLAQHLHPDRWTLKPPEQAEIANAVFAKVSEAWEIIGDEAARAEYTDRVIHGKKTEDELAMEKVQEIMSAENDFKLGLGELNNGRILQAHEAFKAARDRLPEEMEFAAFYGYTLFKLNYGKDDMLANEGEQLIRVSIENGTKLSNGWALVGMLNHDKGELEVAKRALLTSLKLQPTNPIAQRELKRLQRRLEKDKESAPAAGIGGFFSKLFGKK